MLSLDDVAERLSILLEERRLHNLNQHPCCFTRYFYAVELRVRVVFTPGTNALWPKSSSSARPLGRERVTWNNTPKSLMFLVFRETQASKSLSEIVLLNIA